MNEVYYINREEQFVKKKKKKIRVTLSFPFYSLTKFDSFFFFEFSHLKVITSDGSTLFVD